MVHSDGAPFGASDLFNLIIMFGVLVPPALYVNALLSACDAGSASTSEATSPLVFSVLSDLSAHAWPPSDAMCELYVHHPLGFLNVAYFVVVDVGFYAIYLAQGSTWLIDPHWQLIPMAIACFYYSHPAVMGWGGGHGGGQQRPRAVLALALVFLWGARLLHNYFRREGWRVGRQEDWRYADMRRAHGAWWAVSQFFAVSLAQHGMLVGLTLPLRTAMSGFHGSGPTPAIGLWDAVAAALCLGGVATGWAADNQLRRYMLLGAKKPAVLDRGLWALCRHPNHLGEQMWWAGLLVLGVAGARTWRQGLWPGALGVLYNHPLDTLVTLPLIEARMARRPERREAFRAYQARTGLLLPWWPAPPAPKEA